MNKAMNQQLTFSRMADGLKFLIFLYLLFITSLLEAQKPNILLIISDDLNTRIGPSMEIEKYTVPLHLLIRDNN